MSQKHVIFSQFIAIGIQSTSNLCLVTQDQQQVARPPTISWSLVSPCLWLSVAFGLLVCSGLPLQSDAFPFKSTWPFAALRPFIRFFLVRVFMSQPEAEKQSGVADRSPRQEVVAILFSTIAVCALGTTNNLKVFHDWRPNRNHKKKYVRHGSVALDQITFDVPLQRIFLQ